MENNITKTIKESVESLEEKIVYVPFDRHTCESWNDLGQEFIDHALPTNEFRQNLKSHLLQSQIRLIDSMIERQKETLKELDNCFHHKIGTHTCNGCPKIVNRPIEDWPQQILEDQISSLEEVKKEILCMK